LARSQQCIDVITCNVLSNSSFEVAGDSPLKLT